MVLELKLPTYDKNQDAYDIQHHLIKVLPNLGAYVFSFIMIGILWTNHHHMFHLLKRTDNVLLAQNLFFLFWMSLIPFVTGILGGNPLIAVSTAIYGFIMLMTTLSLSIMHSHTLNKNLVHTDDEMEVENKIKTVSTKSKTKTYTASLAYLASVPLAFVSVYLSYICFIIPIILFVRPEGIDEETLAEKVIEKNS
jgi:uncharacterized membrane protein